MKKTKKLASLLLALVVMVTSLVISTPLTAKASSDVYINPFSAKVAYFFADPEYSLYSTSISIMGCDKAKEIKSLKSSNKSVKVSAKDGYIYVVYPKKACTTKITCTVKGVKLKTTLKIAKWKNPFKSIKFNGTNITKAYNSDNWLYYKKKIKSGKLNLKLNSGYKLTYVSTTNNSTFTKRFDSVKGKSSFSGTYKFKGNYLSSGFTGSKSYSNYITLTIKDVKNNCSFYIWID